MEQSFNTKVVAVTGGTDGIGKALVEALLAQGASVSTCGRNQDKLYQLQTENAGAALFTVVADVSKENDCRHFIESTLTAFGHIDILINNAGVVYKDVDMPKGCKGTLNKVAAVILFADVGHHGKQCGARIFGLQLIELVLVTAAGRYAGPLCQ